MSGLRRTWTRRTAQASAVVLLAASGSMFIASTALAAAGGNNGTVQINGVTLTNGNEPHLSCPLTFKWAGFDPAPTSDDFTISVTAINPTGGTASVTVPAPATNPGSFTGPDFNLPGVQVQVNGGNAHKGEYHVNITVETKLAHSTDTKSKTVWLQNCAANPVGGNVTMAGHCTTNTAGSGYTWAVTATPGAVGAGADVTGTFTPPVGGTWSTTNGTGSFTSAANHITVALDAGQPGWTITQPTDAPASCATANNQVTVSGTCNANNNGYSWSLSTNPATGGLAGTFAPGSNHANTTNFTTSSAAPIGTASYTTTKNDSTIHWTLSAVGWPASGDASATALCTNNPQPGKVSVTGHCNTTTQGYDWTVSTAPPAAVVDGTWTPAGGSSTNWTTDASGTAAFSSGVGQNVVDITVTTANWSGPASASTAACAPQTAADPQVAEANHCKSGINVTLSNMNGTADVTFTVTDSAGNSQQVGVRAGQLKKLSFAVKEDTTGTVTVSAPGLAKKTYTYKKNCATVLGVKHIRKPTHKPVVKAEHGQLPFTGFDTKRALLDGAVVFFVGAVLCILGARRREEEPLYY